jgi:hypothetical protein
MEEQNPYEPVAQQPGKENESEYCTIRSDNTGVWNILKTYWIFLAHLAACVLFIASLMEWIDGHNFRPGTPPMSIFEFDGPLYQTQVNGLVSLALVLVRLLAMCCTAPLVWTVILILLENRGMTLPEISRLNNYNVPILPRAKAQGWWWYIWATLVTLLLWPPNFASPIANSSLAWIPDAVDLGAPTTMALNGPTDNPEGSFWLLRAPEWQMQSFMKAVVRIGASPAYAFNTTNARRYFARPQGLEMTNNSIISAPLPYFDMNIRWVNGTNDTWAQMIGNTSFSDYVGPRDNGVSRAPGSVVVMDDEPWDRTHDWPSEASRFKSQRFIAVRVAKYGTDNRNKDGTNVTRDTGCPDESPDFASLPDFPRAFKEYSVEDDWSRDCYQVGIVTLDAGLFEGKDCNVTLVGASEAAATCPVLWNMTSIEDDWVAPVAVHMLSEIAKATVALDYTKPWLNKTTALDDYVTGLLTLAYHAAWSSAMELMPVESANGTWSQASPMVRAVIEKRKIYAWFAMQLTVTVAALLVYAALGFSSVKFVRDTTFTPLRLDFSSVTHHRHSKGLCSAAALSKEDHKLPMVRFRESIVRRSSDSDQGVSINGCRRRIVFVDEADHEFHNANKLIADT